MALGVDDDFIPVRLRIAGLVLSDVAQLLPVGRDLVLEFVDAVVRGLQRRVEFDLLPQQEAALLLDGIDLVLLLEGIEGVLGRLEALLVVGQLLFQER